MKKLLIAAAIVCAAAISQAATANWNVSAANIYNGVATAKTAEKISSGTAYLFDAGKMGQSALYTLLAAGGSVTAQTGYIQSLTISKGAITSTTVGYGEQSTDEQTNKYSFYLVIVDSDKVYFSQTLADKTANKTATAVSVAFGSQGTATTLSGLAPTGTGYAGEKQWSAVPEPTSGLLLLLGVAGLALRRKQK